MTNICRLLNISKTQTTEYHPQGDGLIERLNWTLLAMLATCAQLHPPTWETHLQKVCFAYNSSEHPSTEYSPFYLKFGREARFPVELMFGPSATDDLPPSHTKEFEHTWTHPTGVRSCCTTSASIGKSYQTGNFVWLLKPQVPTSQSRKLYCPWNGPHLVLARLSNITYRIPSLRGHPRTQTVHFDRLKPCMPGRHPLAETRPSLSDCTVTSLKHWWGPNTTLGRWRCSSSPPLLHPVTHVVKGIHQTNSDTE